ncbi:MAG: hypothetical protein KBB88_02360 [Candidatus Pacebacteria bacterium]|nr:hypothetical protein [Candidatus Paceibacterota bacterium]
MNILISLCVQKAYKPTLVAKDMFDILSQSEHPFASLVQKEYEAQDFEIYLHHDVSQVTLKFHNCLSTDFKEDTFLKLQCVQDLQKFFMNDEHNMITIKASLI